jgi:uncharacterized protein YndB with AHSA1/START domain
MQPILHRTYIAAPPQRLYELLVTAEGWDAWFARGAKIDARAGGRIVFRWVGCGPGE